MKVNNPHSFSIIFKHIDTTGGSRATLACQV